MVQIPTPPDPTLNAMSAAIEAREASKPKRDYLGASSIGGECARQIWYQYNGFKSKPFNAETLMRFEDGHRTEELTAERLRMVEGVELYTHIDDDKPFGFTAMEGKFKGHYDGLIRGILQAPKTPHVWECKASGHKTFNQFKKLKDKLPEKEILENWNKKYYVQAQIYMHYAGYNRHYLTVAYAGGREYLSCRTNYKEDVALKYIDRARKIIDATDPPPQISDKPDFYICRFCNFKEICHGG